MSHRKFKHPRHGSLGFLPRKRANRQRGKECEERRKEREEHQKQMAEQHKEMAQFRKLFAAVLQGQESGQSTIKVISAEQLVPTERLCRNLKGMCKLIKLVLSNNHEISGNVFYHKQDEVFGAQG